MTLRITPEPQALAFSVPGPRTLDGQRAVTIQMACPCCEAHPWQDCPAGIHLARWYAARERNLISGEELDAAIEAAKSGRADAIVPVR